MADPTTLAERRGLDTLVYEAAEDSSLLASTVVDDLGAADLVLDVGTGSGYVAAKVAEGTGARVVGSDLNPHACRRARGNGVETVRADLVAPFRAGVFDAVTFNPPYLPVGGEGWDDWFEVATMGGEDGRAVIERFLDDVGRVLAPEGAVYLLVSTLTGVDAVAEYAGERGFGTVAIADVAYPAETLTVLKLVR